MLFQLLLIVLYKASLFLLLSLSIAIIYYPTKFFNIAHAAIITLGGFITLFFYRQLGCNFYLSILIATAACSVTGMVIDLLFYRNLRFRKASSLSLLLLSLGLYVIIINIISLIWGDDPHSINTTAPGVGIELNGGYISMIQLYTILTSSFIFLGILILMKFSILGKKIKAISSNRELSDIFGINSNSVIIICYLFGSAIAGLTGILSGLDTDISPHMGFSLFLYGAVCMIISGVSTFSWLLCGVFIVSIAQTIGAYYIGSMWMDAILYIVLILFLVIKPLGFSGQRLKKVEI